MGRNKWFLKFRVNLEKPVEVVCIISILTELSHLPYPSLDFTSDSQRIVNNNLVTGLGFRA